MPRLSAIHRNAATTNISQRRLVLAATLPRRRGFGIFRYTVPCSEPRFTFGPFFGTVILVALCARPRVCFIASRTRFRLKTALVESAAWIALSLLFAAYVHLLAARKRASSFSPGIIVEKSLSVDNIFVFLLIFQAFQVPEKSQHKVFFYGVIGALVMRAVFVVAGVELLQAFHFVLYFFGAILVFTAIQMLRPGQREIKPERNWLVRMARRFFPVVTDYAGDDSG